MSDSQQLAERPPSNADWIPQLQRLLRNYSENIAIVGVGHPFRGDDYAGSFILKQLMKDSQLPSRIHLYDAENDVEAIVSKLIDLEPACVIFVDACLMNAEPGEIRMIPVEKTEYPFFTTHGIPLKLLCERMLPQSESWMLAIQPGNVDVNRSISPDVRKAALHVCYVVMKTVNEVSV